MQPVWYLTQTGIMGNMMTSSNGNIFHVTGPLCREFTGEFPSQRPVTRSFGVFFHLCLNKRLSKQSWGWWFEMPPRSLWRNCNVLCRCLVYKPHHSNPTLQLRIGHPKISSTGTWSSNNLLPLDNMTGYQEGIPSMTTIVKSTRLHSSIIVIEPCFRYRNADYPRWECKPNTVQCRYNAAQYDTILYTILHWLRQNINPRFYSQKTSHKGQAMGCVLWGFGIRLTAL